jgi:hypothetical protein
LISRAIKTSRMRSINSSDDKRQGGCIDFEETAPVSSVTDRGMTLIARRVQDTPPHQLTSLRPKSAKRFDHQLKLQTYPEITMSPNIRLFSPSQNNSHLRCDIAPNGNAQIPPRVRSLSNSVKKFELAQDLEMASVLHRLYRPSRI